VKTKFALSLLFVFALVLASCGGSSNPNLDKVNGKWTMDIDATMKDMKDVGDNEMAQGMARKLFEAMAITVVVDSKAKQITATIGDKTSPAEAFTVISDSGNTLVLKNSKTGKNMTFEFLDADSLVLRDESDKQKNFVMKRAK
jgi:hypothetical protein